MADSDEKPEPKSERFNLFISPSELSAIDEWGWRRKIRSKADAMRRLCQIGLVYDREGEVLLRRTERALKATLMAIDQAGKVQDLPPSIRGGLQVALEEQIEANKAALSALVAASVYSDEKDTRDISELIERAQGYVQKLVKGEEKR